MNKDYVGRYGSVVHGPAKTLSPSFIIMQNLVILLAYLGNTTAYIPI